MLNRVVIFINRFNGDCQLALLQVATRLSFCIEGLKNHFAYHPFRTSISLSPGDEAGDSRLHHGIEPHAQGDPLLYLPHGVFGQGGDVHVLLNSSGSLGGGQEGRPALDGPRQRDLRRSFAHPFGDGSDDRIRQQVGLAAVAQGRERLQHDPVLAAIVQKFPFRKIGMGFDVHHRRLNGRAGKNLLHPFDADVG